MVNTEKLAQAFEAADKQAETLPWLKAFHHAAREEILSNGVLPSRKLEQWKYTTPPSFIWDNLVPKNLFSRHCEEGQRPDEAIQFIQNLWIASAAKKAASQRRCSNGDGIIFVNGQGGVDKKLPCGGRIATLKKWQECLDAPFFAHFNKLVKHENPFVAINSAFVQDGCGIYVPPNTQEPEPIHVFFYGRGEKLSFYPRVLVVAKEQSQVTLVEHYLGGAAKGAFVDGVSEIILERGASVNHYQCFYEDLNTMHVSSVEVKQRENSHFSSFVFSLGGSWLRQDLGVSLVGEGAQCTLNGLYMTKSGQHVDHHTRILHQVPHCQSKEIYKGTVGKNSRAVFNGKVVVAPQAVKSRASLTNKNLLLDEETEVDTKPELEIYNDDVICTHGATVGQLPEDHLFYLRSRGVSLKQAKKLLVDAFLDELIHGVSIPTLETSVKKRVEEFYG